MNSSLVAHGPLKFSLHMVCRVAHLLEALHQPFRFWQRRGIEAGQAQRLEMRYQLAPCGTNTLKRISTGQQPSSVTCRCSVHIVLLVVTQTPCRSWASSGTAQYSEGGILLATHKRHMCCYLGRRGTMCGPAAVPGRGRAAHRPSASARPEPPPPSGLAAPATAHRQALVNLGTARGKRWRPIFCPLSFILQE